MNEPEEIDYERGLMSNGWNSLFYNTRTGEVVPAGGDDVAGKVSHNRDGSHTAHSSDGQRHQRVATEEAGVATVVSWWRS